MAWTTPGTAVAGDVLTAAFWNTNVRDNTNALYQGVRRLGYQQITSSVNVTQTSLASATNVFSSNITITADGTSAYCFEFYTYGFYAQSEDQSYIIHLVDGSGNGVAQIANQYPVGAGSGAHQSTIYAKTFLTPAAGSRSFNIRGTKSGGANGQIVAGSGTSGAIVPAWFAIYGPDIT